MSTAFLQDILSVPALDQQDLNDNLDISAMDLEAIAFRRGGKDASLCGNPPLANIFPATWPPATPLAHLSIDGLLEVPSWEPQKLQQQGRGQQHHSQERTGSGSRLSLLSHQDSVSSDDGFNTSSGDEGVMPRLGSDGSTHPRSPGSSSPGSPGDSEHPTVGEEDAAMEDEMLMSPEEEARLRSLLVKKQQDLENCASKMKGLTPQNKKRLRNRHASCVSRLKKKLYICNLQRDLERAKAMISALHSDAEAQKGTIAFFRKENDRLCGLLRHKGVDTSARAGPK